MKTTTLALALMFIGVSVFSQSGNAYSSKSGKISYSYEIGDMKTTYTLIFDDFGKKQAYELENNIDGQMQKSKTIITPESICIVNFEDHQVIKFPIDADDKSMEMFGGDNGGFDLLALIADVTENETGKTGTSTVLGKKCDIYQYTDEDGSKGKYWIHKGYLIKAEFIDESGEHAYMEATDFKIDIAIDNSEFKIPSGYEVTDMTEMMEKMKMMQQMYGVPDEE